MVSGCPGCALLSMVRCASMAGTTSPAFASAIVVADALVWEGADGRLLDAVSHLSDFGQCVARALIYRAVTDWLPAPGQPAEPFVNQDP
jgi:hypothetical protein